MQQHIKKSDTQNQFTVLVETYKQIVDAWNNKVDLYSLKNYNFSSIVICGLGGSAISGDLLRDYLSDSINIPVLVNRNYNLPLFVNENSLIVISSYSGNTEETISCFQQALQKGCPIVSVSSGGNVEEISKKNSISHIKIKAGFQPRYALGLSFFTLLKIFQELKLTGSEDINVEIIKKLWKQKGEEYAEEKNDAIEIAEKLIGFIPVIYSAEHLSSVGYRFKCQLNENSKVHAFHHILPEMNHNEIIGWESFKEKQFQTKVIYLLDNDYHPQTKKRFEILKELIQRQNVEVIELKNTENNSKVRIMCLIYLCDWISFYLAVLRGFDPSEIDFIHEMKKRLG